MASEVDICNLALSHLGDVAQVTSINPPDGSMQAAQCARFYPLARDSLTEMYSWGFATKRVPLALSAVTVSSWQYVYILPADAISPQVVLPADATDDWSAPVVMPGTWPAFGIQPGIGVYTPQPYRLGVDATTRQRLLYTNVQDAVLIYVGVVEDPTEFSPLFTDTLALHLASMLAGPIVRGAEGRNLSQSLRQAMLEVYSRAVESDANQQRTDIKQHVAWISAR